MLKKGRSYVGYNMREMMKDNMKKGKARGMNGTPRTRKQMLAIALRSAGVKKK